MKRWGLLITSVYFLIVVCLIVPASVLLMGKAPTSVAGWLQGYQEWLLWMWIGILVGGEALLLFLSVDTSHKRLKPRQHVLVSVALVALMVTLLTFAGALSLLAAWRGDRLFERPVGSYIDTPFDVIAWVLALWGIWGLIFWSSAKDQPPALTAFIRRLMKGSVFELLIAVPAHVWVRHRQDCSAPIVTSWGMGTGVAILLLCFGPGVLLLYRSRIKRL